MANATLSSGLHRLPVRLSQAAGLLTVLLLTSLAQPTAHAQQADSLQNDALAFSAELHGGVATYNDFLEQRLDGRERELTAQAGFSIGAAVGLRLFDRNAVRLSFDYMPGQFEYRDDTGDGRDVLESDPGAEFNLLALSVEAERNFFEIGPLSPYASVGLSGALWNLSQAGTDISAGDSETIFRWGTTSGLGARIRLTDHFFLNVEGNAISVGNPFNGNDAFQANGQAETIDERRTVRTLRFRGGLRYLF